MNSDPESLARDLMNELGLQSWQATVILDSKSHPPTLRVYVFDTAARVPQQKFEWRGYTVEVERSQYPRLFAYA